jgi:hypothetical protein
LEEFLEIRNLPFGVFLKGVLLLFLFLIYNKEMGPLLNQLKNSSPGLIFESEKKIEKAVLDLERKGFFWKDFRKSFYNEELDISFTLKDFESFINDNHFLKEKIAKAIKKDKKEESLGKVKSATLIINLLIFLVIMNLFLGWIIFHLFVWLFFEAFLVFFLISFVKIRKKIKNVN